MSWNFYSSDNNNIFFLWAEVAPNPIYMQPISLNIRHQRIRKIFLLFFFLIFFCPLGMSYDIHTFIDKQCSKSTGIIINVDDKQSTTLLLLSGRTKIIDFADTHQVLVYKTLQNPIKKISLQPESKEYLRELNIKKDAKPVQGWLIDQFEEFLVFYDITGKQHVVNLHDIDSFHESPKDAAFVTVNLDNFQDYQFVAGTKNKCFIAEKTDQTKMPPYRRVTNLVEISQYLSNLENKFFALNSLATRIRYYPRAILLRNKNYLRFTLRSGFYPYPDYLNSLGGGMYFGEPYAMQSTISFVNFNKFLPLLYLSPSLNTEIKSHFLHGGVSSNVLAAHVNTRYMIKSQAVLSNFFKNISKKSHLNWINNYNRYQFYGMDWRENSYLFGQLYPLFGVLLPDGYFREISFKNTSPMFIYQRTHEKDSFSFIFSFTQSNNTLSQVGKERSISVADINDLTIVPDEVIQLTGVNDIKDHSANLTKYELEFFYFRFNYDIQINKRLSLTFSQFLDKKRYKDDLYGKVNTFDGISLQTAIIGNFQFGEKILTKLFLSWNQIQYSGQTATIEKKVNNGSYSVLLALDFLL